MQAVDSAPGGRRVAIGTLNGELFIWEVKAREHWRYVRRYPGPLMNARFVDECRLIVAIQSRGYALVDTCQGH